MSKERFACELVNPKYENYISKLEEKNRSQRRLQQKTKKEQHLEEKEKGFSVYVNENFSERRCHVQSAPEKGRRKNWAIDKSFKVGDVDVSSSLVADDHMRDAFPGNDSNSDEDESQIALRMSQLLENTNPKLKTEVPSHGGAHAQLSADPKKSFTPSAVECPDNPKFLLSMRGVTKLRESLMCMDYDDDEAHSSDADEVVSNDDSSTGSGRFSYESDYEDEVPTESENEKGRSDDSEIESDCEMSLHLGSSVVLEFCPPPPPGRKIVMSKNVAKPVREKSDLVQLSPRSDFSASQSQNRTDRTVTTRLEIETAQDRPPNAQDLESSVRNDCTAGLQFTATLQSSLPNANVSDTPIKSKEPTSPDDRVGASFTPTEDSFTDVSRDILSARSTAHNRDNSSGPLSEERQDSAVSVEEMAAQEVAPVPDVAPSEADSAKVLVTKAPPIAEPKEQRKNRQLDTDRIAAPAPSISVEVQDETESEAAGRLSADVPSSDDEESLAEMLKRVAHLSQRSFLLWTRQRQSLLNALCRIEASRSVAESLAGSPNRSIRSIGGGETKRHSRTESHAPAAVGTAEVHEGVDNSSAMCQSPCDIVDGECVDEDEDLAELTALRESLAQSQSPGVLLDFIHDLTFVLISNHGDKKFIGLTGLTLVKADGSEIDPEIIRIDAPGALGDASLKLSCLLNGRNKTIRERNMWCTPLPSDGNIFFTLYLRTPQSGDTITEVRLWNYNYKNLSIGVRNMHIYANRCSVLMFHGNVSKGCANQVFDYSQTLTLRPVRPLSEGAGDRIRSLVQQHAESTASSLSVASSCADEVPVAPSAEPTRTDYLSGAIVTSETYNFEDGDGSPSPIKPLTPNWTQAITNTGNNNDAAITQAPPHLQHPGAGEVNPFTAGDKLRRSTESKVPSGRAKVESFLANVAERGAQGEPSGGVSARVSQDKTVLSFDCELEGGDGVANSEWRKILNAETPSRAQSAAVAQKRKRDVDPFAESLLSLDLFSRTHRGRIERSNDEENNPMDGDLTLRASSAFVKSSLPKWTKSQQSVNLTSQATPKILEECQVASLSEQEEELFRGSNTARSNTSGDRCRVVNHDEDDATGFSSDEEEFFIPELPEGKELMINILSTWGDRHYVGLTGIELFGAKDGKPLKIDTVVGLIEMKVGYTASSGIRADPADINVLAEYSTDPRVVSNLLDGVNKTKDDSHMWLAPFTAGQNHLIYITLARRSTIAVLRFWNYNKSRIHSSRGARLVRVSLDGNTIFDGELARACGAARGPTDSFGDTILFTEKEDILDRVAEQDDSIEYDYNSDEFSTLGVSYDGAMDFHQRPSTNEDEDERVPSNIESYPPNPQEEDGAEERPFTRAAGMLKSAASVGSTSQSATAVTSRENAPQDCSKLSAATCMPGSWTFTDPSQPQIGVFTAKEITLEIMETWGDKFYVGLTGLAVLGDDGVPLSFDASQCLSAHPRDVTVLNGHEDDERTLDKLFDRTNLTVLDHHMWLAPFSPDASNIIRISMPTATAITGLRVWNYNKSEEDTLRGVRSVMIRLDGVPFRDERFLIRKAPGACFFDFGQDLLFYEKPSARKQVSPRVPPAPIGTQENYEVLTVPNGFVFELHLLSTWGDPFYVGLNGIALYDQDGNKLAMGLNNVAAYPDSVNVLSEKSNDARTPDKLIDGVNDAHDASHSWLAPLLPALLNRVYCVFDSPVTVSRISIWNYSKTPARGLRDFAVLVDESLVFSGVVPRYETVAQGILPGMHLSAPPTFTVTFKPEAVLAEGAKKLRAASVGRSSNDIRLTNDEKVIVKGRTERRPPSEDRPTTSVPRKD